MSCTPFDIAPFALPNTPANEIRFEEPHDIVTVEISFDGTPPPDFGLSYLRKTWPDARADEAARGLPCYMGWLPADDWFNVAWQKAEICRDSLGNNAVRVTFQPLTREFPELADYAVTFRRTLGIRLDDIGGARPVSWRVCTTSASVSTALRVTFIDDTPGTKPPFTLSGHYLTVDSVEPASSEEDPAYSVTVSHMTPAHDYAGDDGLLTFHLKDDAFTISLTSLDREGPVWFEEAGAFICRADDPVTPKAYRERNAGSHTLVHDVVQRGEQSLEGALYGQPHPHPVPYSLGCRQARQRFWLETNGDLIIQRNNVEWVTGKDTPRFRNDKDGKFFFGLEHWFIQARHTDPAPVLAFNLLAARDGVTVEQQSFAAPLESPAFDRSLEGDDTMVALVRFTFRNTAGAGAPVCFPIAYSGEAGRTGGARAHRPGADGTLVPRFPLEVLQVQGNKIEGMTGDGPVLRALLETDMSVDVEDGRVLLRATLDPGESRTAVLKIPYVGIDSDEEVRALESMQYGPTQEAMSVFWRSFSANGAQVRTPQPHLNALHLMHPVHVAITDMAMPGRPELINTSVGTSTYGNFSNEACMIVQDFGQRGLNEDARRRLQVWVEYQGTVPQPGNFTDYDGMFYGAGGYECGAYNQHHGWVLWGLCEHYFLSGDKEWFAGVIPAVLAGADWVFRQRRNTQAELPHSRGWERGFLPAGSLEDVTDFHYWLSTNSLTWRGTEWAARALEAFGHPEARRIRAEADAYAADLRKGFDTARRHAPLVRLRDGRWVPHFPSRLYRRGRETGWIRETLEGAIYLLISGLYPADSREAAWILDDYHDNRYVRAPFSYVIEDFDETWFNRGGISIQPNLLAGLMPHLDRDEIELYLWMFFNAWASCYREDINAMIEHPFPVLGYSNHAHFKTSDQANAMMWLRYIFVYAKGSELCLGRAVPRAWFRSKEPFGISDAVTRFGTASVEYHPGADRIKARVRLDLRETPDRIVLRFRHPDKLPIQTVRLNGAAWTDYSATTGDVFLPPTPGEQEVVAFFTTTT